VARVAIFGYACLDHRFWVTEFPPSRARTPVGAYRVDLGGPGAVGAVTVARLGGEARFVGRRGDDAAGEEIEARLRAETVDTSALRIFQGVSTPVSGILIDPGGERYIFPFAGGEFPDEAEWIPLDSLGTVQAVLVDSRWPAGAMRLAVAARRRELPVVLDLDQDSAEAWRLIAVATHVIADEEVAAARGGADAMLEAIAERGSWGAVTLGAGGVVHRGGCFSAFRITPRDTTGAGDVFHGAFTLALAEGRDEGYALAFASAAGAQRCALAEVPRRSDVVDLLRGLEKTNPEPGGA
jgi:sulfofructose kinase